MSRVSLLIAVAMLPLGIGCKAKSSLSESGDFSGLYSLGVTPGSALQSQDGVNELNQFCSQQNLPAYLQRIAKQLSFNAGYAEHPNAGYDADIVSQAGPDGKPGFYLGQGQMFDGAGSLAMFPPNNGSVDRLVASYCSVALASIGASSQGRTGNAACAYPQGEASKGGSVTGQSAAGSISSSNCIIAKLSNSEVNHQAEIAFCPDAIGANFKTQANGAAGEMSIIIRGGG